MASRARTIVVILFLLSELSGITTLALDTVRRTSCELQCLAAPAAGIRWLGAGLLIGPWFVLAVVMRCKEAFRGS